MKKSQKLSKRTSEERSDVRGTIDLYSKPIRIVLEALVAAQVLVVSGVIIGHGAMVGAFSVVLRDVPARMICAVNPTPVLRPRPTRDIQASGEVQDGAHGNLRVRPSRFIDSQRTFFPVIQSVRHSPRKAGKDSGSHSVRINENE